MKMTKNFKSGIKLAALSMLAISGPAFAQDAGDMARGVFGQFRDFADVMTGASLLLGIGAGIMSAMKFKAHAENPQQEKLTKPIIYFLVAGILIGLPSFLNMGSETLNLDEGTNLNSGTYDRIGG